jgi:short-subunit dehydrogenase
VELDGAQVLLTGATGGIGHAIARTLAARGASLVLTGRRSEILEPLAAETGGTAVACDLSDRAALDELIARSAGVDVLVANAALPGSGPLLDYSPEEIDRALDVNLRAPMLLARALAEQMAGRRRGHLVFISSLAGKAATGGSSVYSATKFGMRGFATSLRDDLRDAGVGVSTVFPGFISDAGMFAEAEVELPRFVAMRRPEQVAEAVATAIERNRAEVDVAPIALRAGAAFSGLMPEISNRLQRRLGSRDIAAQLSAGQRDKR